MQTSCCKGSEKDSDAMEFARIPFMKGSARTQPQPVLFCGKWASITISQTYLWPVDLNLYRFQIGGCWN